MKVKLDGKTETIRLLLIDTPETHHPTKPVQPFGIEAENFARSTLTPGLKVRVEIGKPERDIYNRLLAYIWLGSITFNEMQLEKGFARIAYVFPPNDKYLDEFKASEAKAKSLGVGIWSIDNYVHNNGFYTSNKAL
ncbi:thermonuclease family protein [Paenibacillus albus]|uniref:TNase-like domain-containing protein n=1 Tax=Paenibacillus albus TaxID=2495582 RepID=A0A3Q8X6H1_9BACL|nr:thermonuclease family protein [Paenibacillus albus]AZN40386.1 hypothetical protein EJC50_12555 [Paenibacillus albus]